MKPFEKNKSLSVLHCIDKNAQNNHVGMNIRIELCTVHPLEYTPRVLHSILDLFDQEDKHMLDLKIDQDICQFLHMDKLVEYHNNNLVNWHHNDNKEGREDLNISYKFREHNAMYYTVMNHLVINVKL